MDNDREAENKLKRKRLFAQPFSYPILFQYVLLQLGHGGSLSESSSSLITSPHWVHLYLPLPGFSPVRYIILRVLKIKQSFSSLIFIHGRSFAPMIIHVGSDPFLLPFFCCISCRSVPNDGHVTKIFVLPMLLFPSLRIVGNSNIKEGVPVFQLILIGLSSAHNVIQIKSEMSHLPINRYIK